jgi:hypothetical protein
MEYTQPEDEQVEPRKAALPLLLLLALASALGVAVAVALAGVAMLLAVPAYAQEGSDSGLRDTAGSLVLERHGAMAEAERLSAEIESREDGDVLITRVVEVYHNPFDEPLTGFYLYRLPANVVLDRLSFAPKLPRRAMLCSPTANPGRCSSRPRRWAPAKRWWWCCSTARAACGG